MAPYIHRSALKDDAFRKSVGVQVGMASRVIGIRDSKDDGRGPVLAFTEEEWAAFIDAAKHGDFDLPPKRDAWPLW